MNNGRGPGSLAIEMNLCPQSLTRTCYSEKTYWLLFLFLSISFPCWSSFATVPYKGRHIQKGKAAMFSFNPSFTEGLPFTSWSAYPRSTNFRLIFPPCTTNELDALSDLGPLAPSRIYTYVKKDQLLLFVKLWVKSKCISEEIWLNF